MRVTASPEKMSEAVFKTSTGHTLTWGELLGFIAFFIIVITRIFGDYSVFIGLAILFISVVAY